MAGLRVDVFLRAMIADSSRTFIGESIRQGRLDRKLNHQEWEQVMKPSHRIETGDVYRFVMAETDRDTSLTPEAVEFDIIFEDQFLLVINKPVGLVVHPGSGNYSGTLVHGLLHYYGTEQLSTVGGAERPGIVHRLDKNTSGLMVVAKDDFTHRMLAEQLVQRTLGREYEAIVWGKFLQQELMVKAPIARHPKRREAFCVRENGREAISYFSGKELLARGRFTRISCKLMTGRTHQIRVHLQHCQHQIVGDPLYGKTRVGKLTDRYNNDKNLIAALQAAITFPHQCLHACSLEFQHPKTKKKLAFKASTPHNMSRLIGTLRNL